MFPIIPVNPKLALNTEPLGTKRKYWYRDGDRRILFKAEERGTGEDWAEKIACELCELLGLPHVHYDLAMELDSKKPGVVCETCAPPPSALCHGNQLLLAIDPKYQSDQSRRYKVREHTVDAVADAIQTIQLPPTNWNTNLPTGIESALDVFVGYLMLDAWIANQDRHHENWGVLLADGKLHLAPTFDHGASMARNITDKERLDRLKTRDKGRSIETFARRAKSALYANATDTRSLSTVDSWRAFATLSTNAASLWLARLTEINDDTVRAVMDEVPPHRMSHTCREFTVNLLAVNRRRLLANENE